MRACRRAPQQLVAVLLAQPTRHTHPIHRTTHRTLLVEGAVEWDDAIAPPPRSLEQGEGPLALLMRRRRDVWQFDARNVAGVCLSVAVSLLSSVDRECGATMYLVLFSVLLQFCESTGGGGPMAPGGTRQRARTLRTHAPFLLSSKPCSQRVCDQ